MSALADFSALDKLLNQPDDQPPLPNGGQPVAAAMGPGAIKAPMDTAIIPKPKGVEQARTEIWDEDDIAADDGLQIDPSDTRLRPEYDILYKQDVSANVRAAAAALPSPPSSSGVLASDAEADLSRCRTAFWAWIGRKTRGQRAAKRSS